MRNILEEARIHPAIRARIAGYRQGIVREVEAAIAANEVVVLGPMVFVKGELIGGASELQKLQESGELRPLRS